MYILYLTEYCSPMIVMREHNVEEYKGRYDHRIYRNHSRKSHVSETPICKPTTVSVSIHEEISEANAVVLRIKIKLDLQ